MSKWLDARYALLRKRAKAAKWTALHKRRLAEEASKNAMWLNRMSEKRLMQQSKRRGLNIRAMPP